MFKALLNFMFSKDDLSADNGIELEADELVGCTGDILAGCVEETRARSAEELDGNGLSLAPSE